MITDAMIEAAGQEIHGVGWMRRALEAAERAAWQPVETAPHNEAVILGWMYNGKWEIDVHEYSWGLSNSVASNLSRHSYATHWRPIPEPPDTGDKP